MFAALGAAPFKSPNLNLPTISRRSPERPESASAERAHSSAVAEVFWIISLIWFTPIFICEIASDCCSHSLEITFRPAPISSAFSAMRLNAFAVSCVFSTPSLTLSTQLIMTVLVWCEASCDFMARFLTSFATTANPLPASPALAASTEALSASIFVWNAISSMTLLNFAISLVELLISSIALRSSFIFSVPNLTASLASSAFLCASRAFSAFFTTAERTSFTVVESSSTVLTCALTPCESVREAAETRSPSIFTFSAPLEMSLNARDILRYRDLSPSITELLPDTAEISREKSPFAISLIISELTRVFSDAEPMAAAMLSISVPVFNFRDAL